jgi:hypothetical protein
MFLLLLVRYDMPLITTNRNGSLVSHRTGVQVRAEKSIGRYEISSRPAGSSRARDRRENEENEEIEEKGLPTVP